MLDGEVRSLCQYCACVEILTPDEHSQLGSTGPRQGVVARLEQFPT